jgi:chromosome segregation ATPase
MPIINVVQQGMTSADAKVVVTSTSWMKYGISVRNQDAEDYNINPHEDSVLDFFEKYIRPGEKEALLERKKNNELNTRLKDSKGRYGEVKEWDHLILNFGKEETVNLTDEDKSRYVETLLEVFNRNIKETIGHRMVFVADGHDDTGNFHIHILSHRFPVDNKTKWAGIATDLGRHSEADLQANILNEALLEAGLEPIDNWINAANRSIYEDRMVSDEAKEETTRMIEEAGGQPTLDVRPSSTPAAAKQHAEQRPQIDPQEELLRKLVESHEREAAKLNEAALKASQSAAMAQHAIAALQQKREAEQERDKALAELDQTKTEAKEQITNLTQNIDKKTAALNSAIESLDLESELLNAIDHSVDPLIPTEIKETQDLGKQVAWLSETVIGASDSISQTMKNICGDKPRLEESWEVFDSKDIATKVSEFIYEYEHVEEKLTSTARELTEVKEVLNEQARQREDQARQMASLEEVNEEQGVELAHLSGALKDQEGVIKEQKSVIEQQAAALETSTKLQSETLAKLENATKLQQSSEALTQQQSKLITQQVEQFNQQKEVMAQFKEQIEEIRSEMSETKRINKDLTQNLEETEHELSNTINELEILRRQSATLAHRIDQQIDPDDKELLDKALKDELDEDGFKPKE